ncbi:MAG: ATP-binding protein, partial [Flavobacteriales bacterium]|nr:ATP-binding protein [Flavobacteriales bacterium]
MEMILFIGIPASGKSSFYKAKFFNSHIRVSLDQLNTRRKESKLLDYCFNVQAKFVVDNTNVSREERKQYIERAKENGYSVVGYYFQSKIDACIQRNALRKDPVSEVGVRSKYAALEL